MEEITWTITEPSGEVKKTGKKVEKIPYVALQRTNDKMTESQKEGVRVWNQMVQTLRDAGLMEEK